MGMFDALQMESRFPTGRGFTQPNINVRPADMSGAMTDRDWANREERINMELARQLRGQEERQKLAFENKRRNPDVIYNQGPELAEKITKPMQEEFRLREKAIDVNERVGTARVETAALKQQQDNAVRQMRAEVYKFKAENPDAKIIVQPGGDTIAVSADGTKIIRSFGSSGVLDDMTKLEFEQGGRSALATQNAQAARDLETLRQGGRLGVVAAQGQQQRETNAAKPPEPVLNTQQKVGQYMTAKELASNPNYARYFRFSGANDFTMVPPNSFSGDMTTYNTLRKQIYGEEPGMEVTTTPSTGGGTPLSPSAQRISPAPTQPMNQPLPMGGPQSPGGPGQRPAPVTVPKGAAPPQGMVIMTSPDGTKSYVPAGRVEAYTRGGWKTATAQTPTVSATSKK